MNTELILFLFKDLKFYDDYVVDYRLAVFGLGLLNFTFIFVDISGLFMSIKNNSYGLLIFLFPLLHYWSAKLMYDIMKEKQDKFIEKDDMCEDKDNRSDK